MVSGVQNMNATQKGGQVASAGATVSFTTHETLTPAQSICFHLAEAATEAQGDGTPCPE